MDIALTNRDNYICSKASTGNYIKQSPGGGEIHIRWNFLTVLKLHGRAKYAMVDKRLRNIFCLWRWQPGKAVEPKRVWFPETRKEQLSAEGAWHELKPRTKIFMWSMEDHLSAHRTEQRMGHKLSRSSKNCSLATDGEKCYDKNRADWKCACGICKWSVTSWELYMQTS